MPRDPSWRGGGKAQASSGMEAYTRVKREKKEEEINENEVSMV